MWVFPAFFSAAGVMGRGEAARSRLVDARREAVGVEERPFSRDFSKSLEGRWSQKRGGAKGGAPSYLRRTAREACSLSLLVHALAALSLGGSSSGPRSSCGSALLLWFSSSCGSALLLWFSSSCGLARGPVERPVRWRHGPVASPGDAPETRTGGAAPPAV